MKMLKSLPAQLLTFIIVILIILVGHMFSGWQSCTVPRRSVFKLYLYDLKGPGTHGLFYCGRQKPSVKEKAHSTVSLEISGSDYNQSSPSAAARSAACIAWISGIIDSIGSSSIPLILRST